MARTKGSKNKKTLILEEKIDEYGLDPLEGLKCCLEELDKIDYTTVEQHIGVINAKSKIFIEILTYIYPKRKAVEVQNAKETKLNQVIEVQWADELETQKVAPTHLDQLS